jgi:hypothetical protein
MGDISVDRIVEIGMHVLVGGFILGMFARLLYHMWENL